MGSSVFVRTPRLPAGDDKAFVAENALKNVASGAPELDGRGCGSGGKMKFKRKRINRISNEITASVLESLS